MPWRLRRAPAPSPPPQYRQEGTHPYHRAHDLIVFRQGSRIVPAKELDEGTSVVAARPSVTSGEYIGATSRCATTSGDRPSRRGPRSMENMRPEAATGSSSGRCSCPRSLHCTIPPSATTTTDAGPAGRPAPRHFSAWPDSGSTCCSRCSERAPSTHAEPHATLDARHRGTPLVEHPDLSEVGCRAAGVVDLGGQTASVDQPQVDGGPAVADRVGYQPADHQLGDERRFLKALSAQPGECVCARLGDGRRLMGDVPGGDPIGRQHSGASQEQRDVVVAVCGIHGAKTLPSGSSTSAVSKGRQPRSAWLRRVISPAGGHPCGLRLEEVERLWSELRRSWQQWRSRLRRGKRRTVGASWPRILRAHPRAERQSGQADVVVIRRDEGTFRAGTRVT